MKIILTRLVVYRKLLRGILEGVEGSTCRSCGGNRLLLRYFFLSGGGGGRGSYSVSNFDIEDTFSEKRWYLPLFLSRERYFEGGSSAVLPRRTRAITPRLSAELRVGR